MNWRKDVSAAAVRALVFTFIGAWLLVSGFDRIGTAETWGQFILGSISILVGLWGNFVVELFVAYQRTIDRRRDLEKKADYHAYVRGPIDDR